MFGSSYITLSLARVVVGHVLSQRQVDTSSAASISHVNVNYRQVQSALPPSDTTSTYDYWWPYPPGGVYTSSSTPTLLMPSSIEPTDDTGAITITLTTDTATDTVSIPTSSVANTTSSSTTTSLSSVSTTDTSTFPSVNTTSLPTPLPKQKSRTTTYLIPLFSVLGVILGSLSIWFLYGCLTARRGPHPRASSLEPGPRYVPTHGDDQMSEIPLHDDGGSPSKYSLHGHKSRDQIEGNEKIFSWPTPTPAVVPAKGYREYNEDDPFLVPPSNIGLARTTRTKTRSRKFPFPSLRSMSPDPLSLIDLDEGEEEGGEGGAQYDSLRHKSIRRGILERLKFGTMRRADGPELEKGESGSVRTRAGGSSSSSSSFRRTKFTHNRMNSDLCVDDLKTPERSYMRADLSRKEGVDKTTEWVAGSGFRIVEERLDEIKEQMEGWRERGLLSGQSSPSKESSVWSATPVQSDDKYTALPVRKSPSKSGRSRVGNSLPWVDSSILPSSPPQITSPPLESRLLFTPNLQQQSGSGKNTRLATLSRTESITQSPSSNYGSPLPTNRLLKSQTRTKGSPLPATPPQRSKLSSSAYKRKMSSAGTPAERYAARRDALTKVESILSESWSERDMKGVERVRSPTMFGAVS